MPDTLDLEELAGLVETWRNYVRKTDPPDGFSRDAGYRAGLIVCADQLAETLERMRADA